MKNFLGVLVVLAALTACNQKKTDLELFEPSGSVKIDISASKRTGFAPLYVDFSAYLRKGDQPYEDEISSLKWVIKGPNGFEREIVHQAQDYQSDADSIQDFFYMAYDFPEPGTYFIRLILNDGEHTSPALSIRALENTKRHF